MGREPGNDSKVFDLLGNHDTIHAKPPEPLQGMRPAPGSRIGQYELIRELGRGGMGAVYLARDLTLGRRVAIKFLHRREPALSQRFLVEAQATARCSHENIVIIHDVKESQGIPFMVLEYLSGMPLSKMLLDQALPAPRVVELMLPVARALICAHAHNIVHRDLKPENIFLTHTGVVKVLDFGIAKIVYDRPLLEQAHLSTTDEGFLQTQSRLHLTNDNTLLGTVPYMSPEQWTGRQIDERTDLWAVGIILYTLLIGRHPLAPVTLEALITVPQLDEPMPSAHDAGVDMPKPLADIIDRCLKKDKHQRMGSAKELLAALEALTPDRHAEQASLAEGMSPYAGLTAFQEADAGRFFGRSREIGTALTHLRGAPLLGVAGASGIGKSSFVRAGVLPGLKRSGEPWQSLVIRPGRHPMAALASLIAPLIAADPASPAVQVAAHQDAMQRLYQAPGYLGAILRTHAASSQARLLLFIDQFEELFTLTHDAAERLAFTACLAGIADDALSPLRLVLSIRSDFLDRVAEDRAFMSELSRNLLFLGPPDREGLREAIVRPAERAGFHLERTGMVEQMIDALETTPGCLPLLQFAATKLWEARDVKRRLLTEDSYRSLGGIAGALSKHADAVLMALPASDQALARAILLQLVTPERTRAITSIADLCALTDRPAEVERLVSYLVDARLLVVERDSDKTGAAMVEIIHESLLATWPRLTRWLEENQEDAAFLEQLRTAAKQWDSRGCPPDLVWRGETVAEARQFQRRYRGTLPPVQARYLAAVFALAGRQRRIRRLTVAGIIAFLSLLVAAAAVALVWIGNAERAASQQAALAQQKAEEAEAAEQKIREQLVTIQKQESDRQAALERAGSSEADANKSRAELAARNRELELTVSQVEDARNRLALALEIAEQERAEADAARNKADAASRQLAATLEQERQRIARLEKELAGLKRTNELK